MKKTVSMLLVLTMIMTLFLGVTAVAEEKPLMTIEIYDVAANYQGIQPGWFGKVVKDKFNLELNIIAPQVAGDGQALYQTRSASGALGDIIILENKDMKDCVEAGLIKDITGALDSYENLKGFNEQITALNATIPNNGDGKVYAIPCQMTNTSPNTYSEDAIYTSPMVPWDYFKEVGAPEMNNLADLIDMLAAMQKAHPTNKDGDPVYTVSLWPDWDSNYMENVAQLTPWYGQQTRDSLLISADGTMVPLTDDNGAYYKMLHFLFDLNQRGLVDPDSGTQNWENVVTKLQTKRVLLMWYSWQRGFYNTSERANNSDAYIFAPVNDLKTCNNSDNYYGSDRSFSVGSQVDDAKFARIMEFLDWYASPEGATYQHAGLEGFNYTVNADGTYTQTADGENALMQNLTVPDQFGGGGYKDGNNAINQWIIEGISKNPVTGESYVPNYWKTTILKNQTTMTKEWTAKYGGENQVKYLLDKGMLTVIPSVSVSLVSDTTDIGLVRAQCGQLVKNTSWQMVFAKDEAEFKAMWQDLKTQLDGFGYQDLVKFDMEKLQPLVDARLAAMKK